jgi:protein-tyrosine-phosphatase
MQDLRHMTACRILFVCTGNTCRSPLAEALCTKLLAERLGCAPEALPERGYEIGSAGLAAYPGNPASVEAVDVARELGADLSRHQSRPLTAALLLQADHLIAMTRSHLDALTIYNVPGGATPRLLSAEAADIPDPIGGSADIYRDCARQILHHLEALLPQLQS